MPNDCSNPLPTLSAYTILGKLTIRYSCTAVYISMSALPIMSHIIMLFATVIGSISQNW